MIITIDGPAASGKSAVAQRLARRMGFWFLNTGAMYRAIGLEAVREKIPLTDGSQIIAMANELKIDFDWLDTPPEVLINGWRPGGLLNLEEISAAASAVAKFTQVRDLMVAQQRRFGVERDNLVTEGRDQGSIVFPNAQVKFFLTADVKVRAKRRHKQLVEREIPADFDEVLRELTRRDKQDMTRPVGRLVKPDEAHVIDSSDIHDIDRVVDRIEQIARAVQAS
jgi:CMP/dCMP kinase